MKNQDTIEKMTTEPVGSLILKNAVPTIISMTVTALYNMADTYFVSQLGTSASGAVGIIFSLMAIIQACGFTIGMGSGSITSRFLGAGKKESANSVCSTAVILAFTIGTVLAITGNVFNRWIVSHLGATETILPYAMDYGKYILFGAPFIVTSFVMNNLLRFQGKAALSMIGLTTGGILNIILDPIFISVFNLGISGAAIATLISQAVSFSILLSMFIRKKSTAELSVKFVSKKIRTYYEIITTGLPSLFRQGMGAISAVLLNIAAGTYGDAAVAGMSITTRVFMFLMSIAIGLGQGFQPVCGMNYGAKQYDRVKAAYFFLIKVTTIIMTAAGIFVFIFAPEIVRGIRNDEAVIAVGTVAMRFQCLCIPLHSLIFGANMMLQTTGQKKSATFLSSLRQGLYFIPLILILPNFMGIFGVQISQAASDFLTALTSIPFTIIFFRKMEAQKLMETEKLEEK